MNRAEIIHQKFLDSLHSETLPALDPLETQLSKNAIIDLLETQMTSRLLDIISRRLSSRKESFYTIGSAGHEGNAVIGALSEINDMAFLHYRSCAFALQRAKKKPGTTPIYDTLLAFAASAEDPIAGGRHKVIGSKPLFIPPQTSTIASHLPKAVGTAHALGLYGSVAHNDSGMTDNNIVICSFGDASANHSTAQGAINAAAWAAYQHSPMPIVFICEDNGIGISTKTPEGWIAANFSHKPGLKYFSANGLDIRDLHNNAEQAIRYARENKKPVFLHLRTVRLMGHAGSDIESNYRSKSQILDSENNDPLLYSAAIAIEETDYTVQDIYTHYLKLEQQISRVAEIAIKRPKQTTAKSILSAIWPKPKHIRGDCSEQVSGKQVKKKDARLLEKPLNMAKQINLCLEDILAQYENTLIFGEDVANKGGVYGVTQGLVKKFGPKRVTNTLLDEQTILGMAIGLAHAGFLPIPEIQYLAYVHNAEDQIRGEAASLSFFSDGQFTNPMVIRIAGFAYQKGFGGHFHNDNAIAVFRDIPGIIVVSPSNGKDAAALLHTCIDLARREQRVVIFIEPIALYMTMDLHASGDNLWASQYQAPEDLNPIRFGEITTTASPKSSAEDIYILSYANGVFLSQKAAKILHEQHAINVHVIDIHWLQPLPEKAIIDATRTAKYILIVDECRQSGSLSEALITSLYENQCHAKIARVNAEDSFIPLGAAANLVLPSVEGIIEASLNLLQQGLNKASPSVSSNDDNANDLGAAS